MAISRIELRRLEISLDRPYWLAFGPVRHDNTIVVEMIDGDVGRGFGEATLLTVYTDETIDAGSDTGVAAER